MVNRNGKRFTNEASSYNALGGAFHQFDAGHFEYANLPCWLVFDHTYKQRYRVASVPPGDAVPDWMVSAPTIDELARRLGVAPEGLVATVARFNDLRPRGYDPDFGRGESSYDTWNGDRSQPGRPGHPRPAGHSPLLRRRAPQRRARHQGRAPHRRRCAGAGRPGEVIPGLYAAGNAMAGVTGMVYGGAGGTLGPAMVFGMLAGRAAATDSSA